MENRKVLKTASVIAIILLAAFSRIIPHLPNFTPIAAIALFSGANLNKKSAIIISLSAMLISDFFLGFHSTMLYVYFSFILMVFIGSYLKNNQNFYYLLSSSLISSILFFLITNFGVWLSTNLYVKNFSGLMEAYTLGIPFFRNTILGDFFYTFSLFYGYKFIKTYFGKLHFASLS